MQVWNQRPFITLILVTATFGIVGCGDEEASLVSSSPSNVESASLAKEVQSYRGDGAAVIEPTLEEYRLCNETTSEYTPDAATGTGSGSGSTLLHAMDMAALDALKKDVYDQFTCAVCPDTDPAERCDPFYSNYDLAGAVMSNPAQDCSYNQATGKYECDGEVNFNGASGSLPVLRAGCLECP